MKTISIKKSYDFSPNSKIFIKYGTKELHIKGFGSFSLTLSAGEEMYATHLWTQSKKMAYDKIVDGSGYEIRPRLGKILAFIGLIVFSICLCVFLFTRSRLSLIPLVPIVIYVLIYVTILSHRYLIIEPAKEDNEG